MSTTSWQTSPSAKYYNCVSPNSPGSPVASPSSPTLYQHVAHDDGLFPQNGSLDVFKNGTTNRSQLATTLLKNLEEYQHLEQFQIQNEFGTDWSEENVSLELFNELSALEFTPPATSDFDNFGRQANSVDREDTEIGASNDNESFAELSAEFQNILDNLPRTATAWGEELIDFGDLIPVPAENQGYQSTKVAIIAAGLNDGAGNATESIEIELLDSSTDESENEEDMFMETDVTTAASELGTTYHYLPAEDTSSMLSYSSVSTSMSEDEDHNMLVGEKMLDALLVGNLDEAITFLPEVASPVHVQLFGCENASKTKPRQSKPAKAPKKSTNQRRKKAPKVEKIIRKKEQNKTAALRYRMKKKMEVEVTLEREAELQADHEVLVKQKDELFKEIQMVKQLLKAVFSNRKNKMQAMRF